MDFSTARRNGDRRRAANGSVSSCDRCQEVLQALVCAAGKVMQDGTASCDLRDDKLQPASCDRRDGLLRLAIGDATTT